MRSFRMNEKLSSDFRRYKFQLSFRVENLKAMAKLFDDDKLKLAI